MEAEYVALRSTIHALIPLHDLVDKIKILLDPSSIVEFWGLPPLIPLLQCVNRLGFEICSVNSC